MKNKHPIPLYWLVESNNGHQYTICLNFPVRDVQGIVGKDGRVLGIQTAIEGKGRIIHGGLSSPFHLPPKQQKRK